MPRIQPPARTPLLARALNRFLAWRYGQPFRTVSLLAHRPAYLLPYAMMSAVYAGGRTSVPEQTRRLVLQLVSQLNGCSFCADLGQRIAQENHVDREKVLRVLDFETHPAFTPAERAALQYALESTQPGARVSDETFAELRAHYDERQILELTVAAATENFFNRLTGPLEIESQGFCALPTRERTA